MSAQKTKSQISVMVDVLREFLRLRGLRYRDIAAELHVTERTVTRWFASNSLDTDIVEQLCRLIGMTFFELCEHASKRVEMRLTVLSVRQEQTLVDDNLLHYLFVHILKGWTSQELQLEAAIPEAVFVDALIRLERSGLIDLLPGNNIKLRTIRDIQWRHGGPLSRYNNQWLSWVFEKIDVNEPRSAWKIDALKLSSGSLAQLERKFEILRKEALELGDMDRRSNDQSREWYALVLAARQMDLVPPLAEWSAPYGKRRADAGGLPRGGGQ